MQTGFDKGGKDSTLLVIYCPKKGISARTRFVMDVMVQAGFDIKAKPVTPEMCGSNPVQMVVDE